MIKQLYLKDFFYLVKKNKNYFIILPLVFCIIAMTVSLLITKKYQASTAVYINVKTGEQSVSIQYDELMAGQLLVRDCKEIVKQRGVLEEAIISLGLQNRITIDELSSNVTLRFENNTRVAYISVLDTQPEFAAKLANKLGELLIINASEVMNVNNIRILDKAVVPGSPYSPKVFLNIFVSTIAGILMAFAIMLYREYGNQNIREVQDITNKLKENTLGVVPKYPQNPENIILFNEQSFETLEVFRTIRTKIKYMFNLNGYSKLLVTSSQKGEGKTFVSLGIALSMARSGQKVVIVDADLYNPTLAKHFGMDNNDELEGLTSVATNVFNPHGLIISTFVDNLYLVKLGKDEINYSEIYESIGFKSFDKYLENNFDIVIYDACNIEQSADGLILSAICDGVLFVIESGKTDQNIAMQSINNIKRLGANIIGIVLNKK